MRLNTGTTEETPIMENCFTCGESVGASEPANPAKLCASCAETADLPMSHYFLTQYYYRFAD
ncbi:hypothetical protein BG53_01925 [Paenibacillus darwinianus]|uniref:Uncharacterized protein n=1 Tax=Paenibacillus darwinianus TaxID=1380763 RepID=A0A9W5W730_9BACL|nr:hypothetical protein [Paenibacillus darwinianus]EXX87536.1 hypothetical protein BG52_03950 [Paenibacillus darwinianus]EXX88421.1 hypothetical protein BG53_01925 [Paenibacillus darwinianus]EXX88760.1 hypothetical protein CH50_02860 [Paenibacillus darwinianus]